MCVCVCVWGGGGGGGGILAKVVGIVKKKVHVHVCAIHHSILVTDIPLLQTFS